MDQDVIAGCPAPETIDQLRPIFNELAFGEKRVALTLIASQRGALPKPLVDILERLIDRSTAVIKFEDTVFAALVDEDSGLSAWTTESIAAIRQRLDLNPPFILLDTADDDRLTIPFTHRPTCDFSLVSIPRGYWNRETVQHEFAHAFLQCGIRFLDEGLADWFSDSRPSDPDFYKGPPLRSVLSMANGSDLQFSSMVSRQEHLAGLRLRSRDLIADIYAHTGRAGLPRLFTAIARCPARAADEIEHVLGMSLEAHDNRPTAKLESLQWRLISGQNTRDLAVLAACSKEALELADGSPSWRPVDVGVTALLAGVRESVLRGDPINASTIAVADKWVEEGRRRRMPEGRLHALSAHRELVALLIAHTNGLGTRAKLSVQRIEASLDAALTDDPTDMDALAMRQFFEQTRRLHGEGIASLAKPPAKTEDIKPAELTTIVCLQDVTYETRDFTLQIDDLKLRHGENVALVGPNGSGKSTLIEAIVGLIPTKGKRVILGRSLGRGALAVADRKRIGVLLSQAPIQRTLSVREAVKMIDAVFHGRDAIVYGAMGLDEIAGKKIGELSRGQYQRVMIYCALGHSPSLILLDEASLGLDTTHADKLRELLYGAWGIDRTTLICSHRIDDLQKVDRIVAMNTGRIIASGSIGEFVARLDWTWKGALDGVDAERCESFMRALPQFRRSEVRGGSIVAYGGPAFGPALADFARTQPYSRLSLGLAGTQDAINAFL